MTKSPFKSNDIKEWEKYTKKYNIKEFRLCTHTNFLMDGVFKYYLAIGHISLEGTFIK